MTPINITIITLLGIGITACLIALIYTKIIKPNYFGYSNKNIITKHNYNQVIKSLNSKSKIWTYENVYISLNESKPIILEKIIITYQNVYIITNPIEKKVVDIKWKNNKFKLIYKNKELDLPLDINLCLSNSNLLKNETKTENINVIVLLTNESFISKQINNIHFIQEDELLKYIDKLESLPSQFIHTNFLDFIEKNKVKQKNKRKIFFNK